MKEEESKDVLTKDKATEEYEEEKKKAPQDADAFIDYPVLKQYAIGDD